MAFKLVACTSSPRLGDWQGWAPGIFPDDSVVLVDRPQDAEHGKKNVLIMVEPEVVLHLRSYVVHNAHMFDTIWTCDDVIHRLFPGKAKMFTGSGGAAVLTQDHLSPKEFKISTWTSSKNLGFPGHNLRIPIYRRQTEFPQNVVFFRNSVPPLLPELGNNPLLPLPDDSTPEGINGREVLFDGFQFSVSIENSQQMNYFTDRVLDPLKMKTLPIYWGCPNIGNFFDTSGWIFFDGSPDDLLKKVRALTPDHYDKYIDSINANYEKSIKYGRYLVESFNHQALSQ